MSKVMLQYAYSDMEIHFPHCGSHRNFVKNGKWVCCIYNPEGCNIDPSR